MKIENKSDRDVSWFCFNSNDRVKVIALASGDLPYDAASKNYQPPKNATDKYFVRFTEPGGGNELAGGSISTGGKIVLVGKHGSYSVQT